MLSFSAAWLVKAAFTAAAMVSACQILPIVIYLTVMATLGVGFQGVMALVATWLRTGQPLAMFAAIAVLLVATSCLAVTVELYQRHVIRDQEFAADAGAVGLLDDDEIEAGIDYLIEHREWPRFPMKLPWHLAIERGKQAVVWLLRASKEPPEEITELSRDWRLLGCCIGGVYFLSRRLPGTEVVEDASVELWRTHPPTAERVRRMRAAMAARS